VNEVRSGRALSNRDPWRTPASCSRRQNNYLFFFCKALASFKELKPQIDAHAADCCRYITRRRETAAIRVHQVRPR